MDIDISNQFLLISRVNQWEIFRHTFEVPEQVNSKGTLDLLSSKWLPIDPSVFFTVGLSQINMWDSNTGEFIFNEDIKNGKFVEPSLSSNSLLIAMTGNSLKIKDFSQWETTSKVDIQADSAKWSPYREEYFATVERKNVQIWDLRKTRSAIYSCGYNSNEFPTKKAKFQYSSNVYQDFFLASKTQNLMQDRALGIEFSQDGRFLLVLTGKNLVKVDLCCCGTEYSVLAKGDYRRNKSVIKRIDDGIIVGTHRKLVKYSQNGEVRQILEFPQEPIAAEYMRNGDYLYVLESEGDLHRLASTI